MKDLFDPSLKYMPFEIVESINNTLKIRSQVIANGTKKGYIVELIIDFEKVTDYKHNEDQNGTTTEMIFSPSYMTIKEVDR